MIHSIRFKITAISIAAILVSVLVVFVVTYSSFRKENDRRSVETMNLIGQTTKKALEDYTESIEQSVEMASIIAIDSLDSVFLIEHGAVGRYIDQDDLTEEQKAELDAYFAVHGERVREAFASVASHTSGVVTYYYCFSPDVSQKEHGFFYSKVGKTGFEAQEPIDASKLDPEDEEHSIWYFAPIKRGRPSWVGPYTDKTLNEMRCYSYIVPIYKSGDFIGVLGMDIPFDDLVDLLRPITVYKSGFVCLLDEEGRIFYHPELEVGTVPDLTGLSLTEDVLENENNGDQLIRYESNGQKRQMSYTTLSNGMKLVVIAPLNEINASWMRMVNLSLVVAAIVIILSAFVLMYVMGVITNPLKTLTAASRRLAAEDYDVELDYEGRDEIGELTRAFIRMRNQIKLYIEDLYRKVHSDDLTGLLKMRYFFETAQKEKQRLEEEGRQPVILYFNMIGMKHYNRQYGFEEGDKLLCEIAKILSDHYGEELVSRFTQDNYVVLTERDGLEDGLGKVIRDCELSNGGNSLPMRIGIYSYELGDVSISIAADRAKYACDLQRGSYVSDFYYFDSTMLQQTELARYLINNLDKALEERWITPYYQPIIRSETGLVCDEEVLARWIDPVGGLLPPGIFIPVLENARLIYKLDLYMLDRILENMQALTEKGLPVVPQSLNLSRVDFEACDIVEEVRSRIDASGFPRTLLTIEITESIVGRDFDFMKQQIERFRELGFSVWMDDFGSGYSALDVLCEIRFDLIKFDMRFLQRFEEGEESKTILRELLHMADGLGIETLCEGVETLEQVEFLKAAGCRRLQGYYFSKPVPIEETITGYRSHDLKI